MKKQIMMWAVLALTLAACGPEPQTPPVESTVEAKGSLTDVEVQIEGAWTATSSEAWCTPSSSAGYGATTLQVNMMPNLTGKRRTATLSVEPQSNAAKVAGRRAKASNGSATYVFHQDPADIAGTACHITGLDCRPESITAYLTVTGVESGMFNSVDGLSDKPRNSNTTSTLAPPSAKIPIGTSGSDFAVIAGDKQSYGGDTYGIIGWETGEMELTLRTEPECEKKIYLSQEPMLHPINTDNNIATCSGSAQVRFAIGDKVYFGGGYSGRGHWNSVMGNSQTWGDATSEFTMLDTRTDALTALRPLPAALIWGSAAVIDDKAYVASFQGEVYTYDPKADKWTSSGFSVGRCDALYPMGSELCAVDNASGTVTKYSTSGRKGQSLSLAKGNTAVAVTETANRTWLMIDNDLYIHDAQGLRQLTTLPNNGVVSACNGLFYYYADDEGGVSSYNPTTNQHMRVPMFLMTRGGPGVSDFHSGLPVITNGVCYLLNCGYTRFGDISWSGAQEKNLIRIDMSKSYHVTVK